MSPVWAVYDSSIIQIRDSGSKDSAIILPGRGVLENSLKCLETKKAPHVGSLIVTYCSTISFMVSLSFSSFVKQSDFWKA